MPCNKCGTILLVGKNQDDTLLWCPNCEGIEIVEKSELLNQIGSSLQSAMKDKNKIFKNYSKDSIVGSLCASLESISTFGKISTINCKNVCSTSFAIKDAMNSDNFGLIPINFEKLQHLLNIYDYIFQGRFILQSLIHDEYIVGIKISTGKIQTYSAAIEPILENIKVTQKDDIIYLKPTFRNFQIAKV